MPPTKADVTRAATNASSPAEISRHGWRDVLRNSYRAMAEQNVSLAAAGIAFFIVWAIFPALATLVVFGVLIAGKMQVVAWLSLVRVDLPDEFNRIVVAQLDSIAQRSTGLSLVAVLSAFAFSLWSGMRGARALIAALNLVYGEHERRTFWHRQTLALALCVLGGAFLVSALAVIVGLAGRSVLSPSTAAAQLLAPSRWPILIAAMMLLLSFAYRYGPCRRAAQWRWVTWGATASATIWVAGSWLLSYYAAHVPQLNPLLGSLGSVMLFLFWSYVTVLAILLGAQINAELERHTTHDTSAHRT
jgi:membrane protein